MGSVLALTLEAEDAGVSGSSALTSKRSSMRQSPQWGLDGVVPGVKSNLCLPPSVSAFSLILGQCGEALR